MDVVGLTKGVRRGVARLTIIHRALRTTGLQSLLVYRRAMAIRRPVEAADGHPTKRDRLTAIDSGRGPGQGLCLDVPEGAFRVANVVSRCGSNLARSTDRRERQTATSSRAATAGDDLENQLQAL